MTFFPVLVGVDVNRVRFVKLGLAQQEKEIEKLAHMDNFCNWSMFV